MKTPSQATDAKRIFVTQPSLPPLEEFIPYLQEIWDSKILTNSGPFHERLEREICRYLGVEYVSLFTNGTIALVTALQALRITGEVITTPYSFVASSHSLLWNGIKPVFCDVDPATLNLDPSRIESSITPHTTAIMPVHVYGRPCDVDAIQKIADNYHLRVIYDAAHAFGVRDERGSILNYGDLSVLSFHATKVFHTFEGGAIVAPDAKTKLRIDRLKNFGFVDETVVVAAGINGKMSEVNAAFGIVQLKHLERQISRRREIDALYRSLLKDVRAITCLSGGKQTAANYAYFPVLVEDGFPMRRDDLYFSLKASNILARRYFYPLITDFPMYRTLPSAQAENLPVATAAAQKVICLPMYAALTDDDVRRVVAHIAHAGSG